MKKPPTAAQILMARRAMAVHYQLPALPADDDHRVRYALQRASTLEASHALALRKYQGNAAAYPFNPWEVQ